jgi:GT2 family glycosyltransferase
MYLKEIPARMEVSFIIAIHNRLELTKRVVRMIEICSRQYRDYIFKLIVVDDGSTDGSKEFFSTVRLPLEYIEGNGNLYWAKSMLLGQQIVHRDTDLIILLNNDVDLYSNFFVRTLDMHLLYPNSVLVGQFVDPATKIVTYGGLKRDGINPLKLKLIGISEKPELADTFNANFVVIPSRIFWKIGKFDGNYAHAYADLDYGYRVRSHNVTSYAIPGALGECSRNPESEVRGILKRIREFNSIKKSPLRSQIRFFSMHGSFLWVFFVISPYLRIAFEETFDRISKKRES